MCLCLIFTMLWFRQEVAKFEQLRHSENLSAAQGCVLHLWESWEHKTTRRCYMGEAAVCKQASSGSCGCARWFGDRGKAERCEWVLKTLNFPLVLVVFPTGLQSWHSSVTTLSYVFTLKLVLLGPGAHPSSSTSPGLPSSQLWSATVKTAV